MFRWHAALPPRLVRPRQLRRHLLHHPQLLLHHGHPHLLPSWLHLLRQEVTHSPCRCPERYHPGRYDICGHSHQIWHTFVMLAIIFTYLAALASYEVRNQSPMCPPRTSILWSELTYFRVNYNDYPRVEGLSMVLRLTHLGWRLFRKVVFSSFKEKLLCQTRTHYFSVRPHSHPADPNKIAYLSPNSLFDSSHHYTIKLEIS